jgi:hypothetical protein
MPAQRPPGRFTIVGLGLVIALLLMLPAGVAADATPVNVGTAIQFAGNGFTPNDSLSFWETGPDNNPIPLGGTQSDGSGGFNFTVSFPSAGTWQVTAHSITSGKEVTGNYAVGAMTSPATTASNVLPAGTLPSGIGAPVSFSGSGFTASEQIALWETAPDSTVTPLTAIQADTTGAFTTSVTFPTAGNWQVTAKGVTSGVQVIGSYAVGTTSVTGLPATAPVSSTTAGVLPPGTLSAGIGTPVTFSGSGFTANEHISLWETGPDSIVTPLSGTGTDSTGAFNVSITFPTAGNWQITAQGLTSGVQVIGHYAVGTTGATSSSVVPTNGGGFSPVPPVALGAPVTFSGSGFNGGETIKLWDTAPNAIVTPLSDVAADSSGRFTATVTFPDVGNWQITAHGIVSLHEVIGRYTITSDGTGTTTSTAPATTTSTGAIAATTGVINTTVSTTISFMPTGYTAGELVSVWSTGPDGSVTTLDTMQASSTGQVTIPASFASAGLWQITAQGRTSGRSVVGRYQVADRT